MKIIKISQEDEVIPAYCAWCKKHLRGEDVGYNNPGVSHGICPDCFKKMYEESGVEPPSK